MSAELGVVHDSLTVLAEAVSVTDRRLIHWLGEQASAGATLPDALVREALVSHLADVVYSAYYVFGAPRELRTTRVTPATLSGCAAFVRALVDANRGAGHWYTPNRHEDPARATVWGVDYAIRPVGEGASTDGRLRLPSVLPMRSPGYVMFFGDAGPAGDRDLRTVRCYWNVLRRAAPGLITELTTALNRLGVPFQLKVVYANTAWTPRADPMVLYLSAPDLLRAWPSLRDVHQLVRDGMRPYVPAMTRPVACGLAVADDPPGHESFGMYLATVLAEGIVAAHEEHRGTEGPSERCAAMVAALERVGRSVEKPHLNPGHVELSLPLNKPRWVKTPRSAHSTATTDWLARADEMASRIAGQSLWSGNRCTWLTTVADTAGAEWRCAGADLYGGLAGLALFFGELHRSTGKRLHYEHAVAAGRQALATCETLPLHGLHAGAVGAGAAIAAVGVATNNDGLRSGGLALVRSALAQPVDPKEVLASDVIYGLAGSVIAILWATAISGPAPGDSEMLGRATVLGELLVNEITGWRPEAEPLSPGSGMAHGASASVWALSELAAATGAPHFANAARDAARAESAFFDPALRNWTSLPGLAPSAANTEHGRSLRENRFDWCYGAPGVSVARRAYWTATSSADSMQELRIAVTATRAAAKAFPDHGHEADLCHGSAGIAEVLGLVPAHLAEPDDIALRAAMVEAALVEYADADRLAHSPGLMLGAAGAGYAALRMAAPATVSPLAPISSGCAENTIIPTKRSQYGHRDEQCRAPA